MADLKLNNFLDEIIGPIQKDTITCVYGPPGIGKTTFSFLYINKVVSESKKVIYIDTEGGFSVERLKQINPKINLNNILVFSIRDFDEQEKTILKLLKLIEKTKKVGLVVVDSLVMLYRLKLGDKEENIKSINSKLANQLRELNYISRNKKIPIIVINQMYKVKKDILENSDTENKMVGGTTIEYWAKTILELDKIHDIKQIKLIKHKTRKEGEIIKFELNDFGFKKTKSKSFNFF